MSFEVINAPVVYIDQMNKNFELFLDIFGIIFIDDILIYLRDEESHFNHLHVVLHMLKENKLYAKFSKCKFRLNNVNYLGHVISSEGIFIDQNKICLQKTTI